MSSALAVCSSISLWFSVCFVYLELFVRQTHFELCFLEETTSLSLCNVSPYLWNHSSFQSLLMLIGRQPSLLHFQSCLYDIPFFSAF